MEVPLFSWNQIGNIENGRPNLGPFTRVEVYRMQHYSMRVALEEELGKDGAKQLLFRAGRHAGLAFAEAWLPKDVTLNQYLAQIQIKLEEFGIGVLRVEKVDLEKLNIVLTVSEDLDCSGLPVNGTTVCDFDEGFLQGVFYYYTDKNFDVREIDCWSTGDRTCRFAIKQQVEGV
jgi:uncharacterized protein